MKKAKNLTKEYRYTLFVLTIELMVSITQALPLLSSAVSTAELNSAEIRKKYYEL